MVFSREGKLLDAWGEAIFEDAHGICITPDDTLYFVDRNPQVVLKFNKQGKHRLTLGKRYQKSDTGYTQDVREPAGPNASGGGMPVLNGVHHAGPPFHHPTDVSVTPAGEIYVSDGYRNAACTSTPPMARSSSRGASRATRAISKTRRTSRASSTRCIQSGSTPARCTSRTARTTASRSSRLTASIIDMWTGFERPTKLYVDRENIMYVAELEDRVSIVDLEGNVLGRFGSERSHDPGKFWGPHGIWTDSVGDLYVAEVLEGARLQKFARRR